MPACLVPLSDETARLALLRAERREAEEQQAVLADSPAGGKGQGSAVAVPVHLWRPPRHKTTVSDTNV